MMAAQRGDNDAGSFDQGISFELRARDLPSKRLLGKGLASIVYETEWSEKRFARKDFIGVPTGTFQKEAAILVGLKDHENVVKTHGRTVDRMSCSLVLEYMEEDLLDLLQKRKESQRVESGTASGNRCEGNPSYPFELSEALAILSQIARGMDFLHEQNIPHGDLKTKNILVSHINDGDKNVLSVKVADFGLVRTKSKSMSFVSRQARKLDVVQWKAPEVLERLLSEDNDVTSSESDSSSDSESTVSLGVSDRLGADVYSFAVTCSQILTGEGPYPNGNWRELGSKIVSGELRPNLPAACRGLLKSLLDSCWTKVPAHRPPFSYIREVLDFWLEVRGSLSLQAPGPLSSKSSLSGRLVELLTKQREQYARYGSPYHPSTTKGQNFRIFSLSGKVRLSVTDFEQLDELFAERLAVRFAELLAVQFDERFAELLAKRFAEQRDRLAGERKRFTEARVERLRTPLERPRRLHNLLQSNPDFNDPDFDTHSIRPATKPRPVGKERLLKEFIEEILKPSERERKMSPYRTNFHVLT